MKIEKVRYRNFRNILKDEVLLPAEGLNIIYGFNAQGKTNLLEGIWLFSGLRSFRGTKFDEMAKNGENNFSVTMEFVEGGRKNTAAINYADGKKSIMINGIKKPSVSAFLSEVTAVSFTPDDIKIISGAPVDRRNYIDSVICRLYPQYVEIVRKNEKLVRQRNNLIRFDGGREFYEYMLDAYEEEIAKFGLRSMRLRRRYLQLVGERINKIFENISLGKEKITLDYITNVRDSEEEIKADLKAARAEDERKFTTTVGVHKDEIDIKINGLSVRKYGSQGQKRSAALSLKLAEAEILKEAKNKEPVILLDDVMNELDATRQEYLFKFLKGRQVFITSCDPHNLQPAQNETDFYVKDGKVYPAPSRDFRVEDAEKAEQTEENNI